MSEKRTLVGVAELSATRAHESSRRALCGTMASIPGINGSERRSETKWRGQSMARLPEEDVGVVCLRVPAGILFIISHIWSLS
jgi:hypothetical protein